MTYQAGTALFVSPDFELATPSTGEAARLRNLSERLAGEWDVCVLLPERCETDLDWATEVYTFQQWSAPFLTDLNPAFVRTMHGILHEEAIDVVHLSKGVCATKGLVRARGAATAVVYAAQNVEADHAADFVDDTLPLHKQVLGPKLIPLIERATVACADYLTAVSERDRNEFVERYGVRPNRISAVPTGTSTIDPTELPPPSEIRARYDLDADVVGVFHGTYSHPPNREAVELLREFVAPRVAESLDVQFLLIGKGMPEAGTSTVRTAGFVEDLFAVLNAADVAVAPIRHGEGTKTKLLDYVGVGLPVVTTQKGAQGIDIEDGVHGYVTPGVDDNFVDAVRRVAGEPDTRTSMAAAMRELATRYDWEQSAATLRSFYERIVDERAESSARSPS